MFVFLQRHKHRKVYADTDIDEDDIEGKRTYDLNEKLQSNRYNADFVSEMKGDGMFCKIDINLKIHFQLSVNFINIINYATLRNCI